MPLTHPPWKRGRSMTKVLGSRQASTYTEKRMFIKGDLTAYALYLYCFSLAINRYSQGKQPVKGRCFTQVVISTRFQTGSR
jgi:hypothetical protein